MTLKNKQSKLRCILCAADLRANYPKYVCSALMGVCARCETKQLAAEGKIIVVKT